jgi:hypothetical protein
MEQINDDFFTYEESFRTFYTHFGFEEPKGIIKIDKPLMVSRMALLYEELAELEQAYEDNNMEEIIDALVDIGVVLFGTAYLFGLLNKFKGNKSIYKEAWDRVIEANMAKKRVETVDEAKRKTLVDFKKPAGWKPPTFADMVEEANI